jgi:hypothetical protein
MARVEKVGYSGEEAQVEVVVGVDGKGAIECRICQEEGEEDAMDSPCACTGTLKVNSLCLSPFALFLSLGGCFFSCWLTKSSVAVCGSEVEIC